MEYNVLRRWKRKVYVMVGGTTYGVNQWGVWWIVGPSNKFVYAFPEDLPYTRQERDDIFRELTVSSVTETRIVEPCLIYKNGVCEEVRAAFK